MAAKDLKDIEGSFDIKYEFLILGNIKEKIGVFKKNGDIQYLFLQLVYKRVIHLHLRNIKNY
ncbi:hypothetical protein SD457_26880 [Coprobacillaceae bacterium CR2/5/TPMF4]|nr:hypothetical protein SD457_26880 [Coprobacillaceae bacterium CR2/5/TPMF4]